MERKLLDGIFMYISIFKVGLAFFLVIHFYRILTCAGEHMRFFIECAGDGWWLLGEGGEGSEMVIGEMWE